MMLFPSSKSERAAVEPVALIEPVQEVPIFPDESRARSGLARDQDRGMTAALTKCWRPVELRIIASRQIDQLCVTWVTGLLRYAQDYTAQVDFADLDGAIRQLGHTNAFNEPESDDRLMLTRRAAST